MTFQLLVQLAFRTAGPLVQVAGLGRWSSRGPMTDVFDLD